LGANKETIYRHWATPARSLVRLSSRIIVL
jgi:hypothetical protein